MPNTRTGKGTQSLRLLKRFPQLSALSSGDLLRDNVHKKTALGMHCDYISSVDRVWLLADASCDLGKEVQNLIEQGSLVPDALILRLIVGELAGRGWLQAPVRTGSSPDTSLTAPTSPTTEKSELDEFKDHKPSDSPEASYILDGFPRNSAQAAELDKLVPVNMVVHLQTPIDILVDRIANRLVHAPSGRVYNLTFNPPKVPGRDDITGEPLTKRQDDDEQVYRKRLKSFEETSKPLLEHYDKKGLLWRVKGNSSDEISPKLFTEFEHRFI